MLGHSVFNLAILIFNLFEGKQHKDFALKLTQLSCRQDILGGAVTRAADFRHRVRFFASSDNNL